MWQQHLLNAGFSLLRHTGTECLGSRADDTGSMQSQEINEPRTTGLCMVQGARCPPPPLRLCRCIHTRTMQGALHCLGRGALHGDHAERRHAVSVDLPARSLREGHRTDSRHSIAERGPQDRQHSIMNCKYLTASRSCGTIIVGVLSYNHTQCARLDTTMCSADVWPHLSVFVMCTPGCAVASSRCPSKPGGSWAMQRARARRTTSGMCCSQRMWPRHSKM